MKFRKSSRDKDLTLNVVPLTDVALVLLIFFMATTSFNNITQLSLSLPEVDKSFNESPAEQITLNVTAEGDYYLNDQKLINNQKRTLISAVNLLVKENKNNIPFVISGDGKAPHQAIVTALDAAGELGLEKVRIAAVKE